MPKIAYQLINFAPATLATIEHAAALCEDYMAQGLTLTLRQLYYRFVAADLIPNTERSYKTLGKHVANGRLAGLIDWDAIEDRGRNLRGYNHLEDPAAAIEEAADSYRTALWKGQPNHVEVWVEKQALESVVGRAANKRDVDYYACKGYVSASELWRAARRFQWIQEREGKDIVLIHLGDHDPSGMDMTRDIDERLNELFGVRVSVRRIALNMDQVDEHRPPPNPAKLSDSRAGKYVRRYGRSSWELDALEPAILDELILEAIDAHLEDPDLYNERRQQFEHERAMLRRFASHYYELEQHAHTLEDEED